MCRPTAFDDMEFHGFTTGLTIILGGIVASFVLVALVRRLFSTQTLGQAHDVTGNLLSVVGTFYAVLLGLVVVVTVIFAGRFGDEPAHEHERK